MDRIGTSFVAYFLRAFSCGGVGLFNDNLNVICETVKHFSCATESPCANWFYESVLVLHRYLWRVWEGATGSKL